MAIAAIMARAHLREACVAQTSPFHNADVLPCVPRAALRALPGERGSGGGWMGLFRGGPRLPGLLA